MPAKVTDEDLRRRLFPKTRDLARRPGPDREWVKKEVAPKGVTLHHVWQTYREGQPDGYSYSRFCELFREWRKSSEVVMRLVHKAGEALFVDYAGQSLPIVDPDTGVITRTNLRGHTRLFQLHVRGSRNTGLWPGNGESRDLLEGRSGDSTETSSPRPSPTVASIL